MLDAINWAEVISTIFYTALGLVMLWISWKVIQLMSPFSIIKEIEEDQNTSLAVLIASVFVSMSIIIAAVIVS
jgi:uncharacterized membrane protein YjfL (UPF0719 family)